MSTISVPLDAKQVKALDDLVVAYGSNRAAVMRKALERLAEDEAISAILLSENEIAEGKILRGNLEDILA